MCAKCQQTMQAYGQMQDFRRACVGACGCCSMLPRVQQTEERLTTDRRILFFFTYLSGRRVMQDMAGRFDTKWREDVAAEEGRHDDDG